MEILSEYLDSPLPQSGMPAGHPSSAEVDAPASKDLSNGSGDSDLFSAFIEICEAYTPTLTVLGENANIDGASIAESILAHLDLVASEADLAEVVDAAVLSESNGVPVSTESRRRLLAHDLWNFWESKLQSTW